MKLLIYCMLVAAAVAAPPFPVVKPQPTSQSQLISSRNSEQSNINGAVQVLRYDNNNIGTGNYEYGFEQSDGTKVDVQSEVNNEGREDESIIVRGSYEWVASDGSTYTVRYIADKNGYRPVIEKDGTPLDRHTAIQLALLLSG